VSLKGQELRMSVDDVKVLEILIPLPLEGKQTGLIAAGSHPVRFSSFRAAADRPRAFVAMEYREPFDTFYREVIKPQAEKLYEVVRIDEKSGPGVIFQDMQREIRRSDVVIAEITPANPNVFYELGYAQAPEIRPSSWRSAAASFRSISPAIVLCSTTTASGVSRAWKKIWRGTWMPSANLPANRAHAA